MRALLQQLNNPDPEPEKQATLMQKHREDLHDFQFKAEAKRQKTQGDSLERREEGRDRPGTPSAVPHAYVESRRSGRGHSGTVLAICENDDAVGRFAPAGNLP